VVGVALNPDKQPLLSAERRVGLLTELARELGNVSAIAYAGATVTFAKAQGCTVLVRGLRNAADLDAEFGMAQVNRANGLDTLFLVSDAAHQHLSSRLVKLVANAGLPLDALVPRAVLAALTSKPG
jgi:pantetheine-phosphate adenylyltransferase